MIVEDLNILLKQNRNILLTKFNGTNQKYGYPVIKYHDVKWLNVCPFSEQPLDYSLTTNNALCPATTPRLVKYIYDDRPYYFAVSAYGRDLMVKSFSKDKMLRPIVFNLLAQFIVKEVEDDNFIA